MRWKGCDHRSVVFRIELNHHFQKRRWIERRPNPVETCPIGEVAIEHNSIRRGQDPFDFRFPSLHPGTPYEHMRSPKSGNNGDPSLEDIFTFDHDCPIRCAVFNGSSLSQSYADVGSQCPQVWQ